MSKRRSHSKRLFVWGSTLLGISFVIVFGISYYALRQFTSVGDIAIYGKKVSELTQEIRSELLKRQDLAQVKIPSSDNLTLSGFLIKRHNPTANVIFCHGYRSTKELIYAYIDLFPDWNILMFDFRAHGQSEGSMTTIGYHEYKDVIAATQFMHEAVKDTSAKTLPFIILGLSMGGAAAPKAIEHEPGLCNALIIDSTYAHMDKTLSKVFSAKSRLPSFPFFYLVKTMFHYTANCNIHAMQPADTVKNITQPILFIHSCDDSYIPPKNSIELYANAHNKKSQLWIGPSCRHGWLHSYHSAQYKQAVSTFLKQTFATA